MKTLVIIAHYGLDRKITETECKAAVNATEYGEIIFIDFEACSAKLEELYDLPFDNIALAQRRNFLNKVTPILENNPSAHIAYFGLTPISIAFHFGYLLGNTHSFTVFQFHHSRRTWFDISEPPVTGYQFEIISPVLPLEVQKGKGNVIVRIGTSYSIDRNSTLEIIDNPANEFDITLKQPDVDALYNQSCINVIVDSFQAVLNAYTNKLSDREQIHLFMACSAGLPFALGTRINPNVYPYIQTYQFSRDQRPKYREAILISKESYSQVPLSESDRTVASAIRTDWNSQLNDKIKPFIKTITGKQSQDWLRTVCESDDDYKAVRKHLKTPWDEVIDIGRTNLKDDKIDTSTVNVEGGFEYIERTNTWQLDDGFLSGLKKRLEKNQTTDLFQAARLFFFHEALHYANEGHRLTRETADGIGQFPKVIEDADYQADVWGLLTEFRYCQTFEPQKIEDGIKSFFCNAIDTAVETMWSFVDNGNELDDIQIRSMNRFLNWYWQWVRIEACKGKGTLEEVVFILFNKPVIEFAGAPMTLRAHRTFYKLKVRDISNVQLAAFYKNKVYRFAPNLIGSIVDGFLQLNGEKIKQGLKSFHNNIN
jgi:SMODS-associated and fused to various effectors sensor domain